MRAKNQKTNRIICKLRSGNAPFFVRKNKKMALTSRKNAIIRK